MLRSNIIQNLHKNKATFKHLLQNQPIDFYSWKVNEFHWSLLEIACHLYDEEREDFKARIKHTLFTPDEKMPPIDPEGWVKQRNYKNKDYTQVVTAFLAEREKSVEWLNSLESPNWENCHEHPVFGPVKAQMFLENWLAHDYLHIRQIIKVQYLYLKHQSKGDFRYAGDW